MKLVNHSMLSLILAVGLSQAQETRPQPPACRIVHTRTLKEFTLSQLADELATRDVVYFGRNRPDGGTVSDAEWEAYLDSVVTPRFPAGFTVLEAEGHWRGQGGVVERERTEVLTLLHSGDEASREAVRALTEEYVRRFDQEAVLRERLPACARF